MKKLQIIIFIFAFGFIKYGFAAEVSLTFDDFDLSDSVMLGTEERSDRILKVLDSNKIKTTLFVQATNVQSKMGKVLLKKWDQKGHQIANHSFSHLNYNSPDVSFSQFTQDLLKAENLIKETAHFQKLFRFPYLHEGDTQVKRDQIRKFLEDRQYQVGHVTIDASDWYISDRMENRIQMSSTSDLTPYRDYFLKHILERANFYNNLSKQVLGREVKHTLLLHYNLLNTLFLEDLIAMFKQNQWTVISSSTAFLDPVFRMNPKILPAGNSILWALAKETGKYNSILRDPGEDSSYEKEPMDKLGL